jgi:hypothetical protein
MTSVVNDTVVVQPVDGGSKRLNISKDSTKPFTYYYWTQTIDDVTICVTLPKDVKASDIACTFNEKSMKLTVNGNEVIDNVFPYKILKHDSVWSINDKTLLLIHIPKPNQLKGFWSKLFENDEEEIDIMKLGLAPGETEKDRKEKPVKVEDPKTLAKIAKEHPELGIKLGISNNEEDNTNIGKQSVSSVNFKGKSSFQW